MMLSRLRFAIGLATGLLLITAAPVLAKGNFAYIAVSAPDLPPGMRLGGSPLAMDFFAFADLSRRNVDAPADPGAGYEITRYYVDHGRQIAFDHFHYYPDANVVYYDGMVAGASTSDGKWYRANRNIEHAFFEALNTEIARHAVHIGLR